MRAILIGTTNEAKYQMYKEILSSLEEKSFVIKKLSKEEGDALSVPETLDDLKANAIKKAVAYAKHTGYLTIADDAGFFIPALNNEPGIAVRRWGGKFPDNISDKEWEKFFLDRMSQCKVKEPECFKKRAVAVSDPEGNYKTVDQQFVGKIKIPGAGHYVSGAPLSAYFFIEKCQRFDADLTEADKDIVFAELKAKLFEAISQFGYFYG